VILIPEVTPYAADVFYQNLLASDWGVDGEIITYTYDANGYVESFNSKLRDELLDRELILHIDELRYVADRWRMDYNHYRPHSSLDYMAPAAFAAKCLEQGSATLRLAQDKEYRCEILS
jgi:transposase InsO family protein